MEDMISHVAELSELVPTGHSKDGFFGGIGAVM
jgi:hypothetical protein